MNGWFSLLPVYQPDIFTFNQLWVFVHFWQQHCYNHSHNHSDTDGSVIGSSWSLRSEFFPLATALSKQSIIYYNSISIGIYALFSLHPLTTWDPPQSHLVYKLNWRHEKMDLQLVKG